MTKFANKNSPVEVSNHTPVSHKYGEEINQNNNKNDAYHLQHLFGEKDKLGTFGLKRNFSNFERTVVNNNYIDGNNRQFIPMAYPRGSDSNIDQDSKIQTSQSTKKAEIKKSTSQHKIAEKK